MDQMQSFCSSINGQSLCYSSGRNGGPVVTTVAAVENGNLMMGGIGKTKSLARTPRPYGQTPYCCSNGSSSSSSSSSQQSKLLYSLLSSSRPKDGSDQLCCMPIIENQPVSHHSTYNGNGGVNGDSSTVSTMSNPPPPSFKFDLKSQLAAATADSNSRAATDLLMPFYRQRSQSMGSNGCYFLDVSRTSSHDSLASYDSISDENLYNHGGGSNQQQSEVLLEVTRKKLMNLLMGGNGDQGGSPPNSHSPASQEDDMRSLSQPGSPPSSLNVQEVCRKYSEGSQRVHLKAKLQSARARYDHLPVDLSCKRKKLINGLRVPKQSLVERMEADMLPDEGIDETLDHSILKSVLTGRGRSNSLSVFELRRLRLATSGRNGERRNTNHHLLNQNNGDLSHLATSGRLNNARQRVTLAKKNLLPVIARVSDRLNKIMEFAKSLPEFTRLSVDDQKVLLTNACPRLLLLYLAETNLQFAVTTIPDSGFPPQVPTVASSGSLNLSEFESPTMQFVDFIQNFIRRCQMINISANEYFYMRLITLFHVGSASLERSDLADVVYSEARQDLQDLVRHSHPNQKLRYSTLLLALHTLFGIHCGMLQALFCKHLSDSGGIASLINKALSSSASE